MLNEATTTPLVGSYNWWWVTPQNNADMGIQRKREGHTSFPSEKIIKYLYSPKSALNIKRKKDAK